MSVPVRIEFGNHKTTGQLPAVPRKGDHIRCRFESSGLPELFLKVTGVYFNEVYNPEQTFQVTVTTDGDPAAKEHNEKIFNRVRQSGNA